MRAAAYARFSSDSQREESIEIQLAEVDRLIERHGWERAGTYTDYAVSGTREDRPGFNRCVADGIMGAYDVLVVYKIDRFARNVKFAQECKRRLFAAGIRLWSVREGEQTDTPEGFLFGTMSDIWAEYYSRNLSVQVKGGIHRSAMDCKAAGRRIYGYSVDADDRFVIDPAQADVVRSMYRDYVNGRTMNEIRDGLNGRGIRNRLGRKWTMNTVGNVLANPAYRGLYRYDEVEVEGAVPAIVDDETWDAAQARRMRRKNSKRRKVVNDYLLTEKVYCLECGRPMCGTAGTSRTGKKYTYYGCVRQGGCGLRTNSRDLEYTVTSLVAHLLSDPETIQAIAEDMVAYGRTVECHADEYRSELAAATQRRDRLVTALGDGAPYQSLASALHECESSISDLKRLIAEEETEMEQYADVESAKAFLMRMMRYSFDEPDYSRILIDTFIDRIYADRERMVVTFDLSAEPGGEPFEYSLDEIKAVADGKADRRPVRTWRIVPCESATKKCEPAGKQQVRTEDTWSG